MEPELTPLEETKSNQFQNLNTVTPLSKYLAMALFIALPFVGGWVGYTFAPEKVVEVERVVEVEVTKEESQAEENIITEDSVDDSLENIDMWGNWSINEDTREIYYKDAAYSVIDSSSVRNVGEAPCTAFIADDASVYAVSQNSHPAADQPEKLFEIIDADPATFEADIADSGNCYEAMVSRDKNYVFYGDKIVEGADPKTFKQDFFSEKSKYDENAIYDEVDGEVFVIENFIQLSQDKDSIFLRWEKIEGVDQDTFRIINDKSDNNLFGMLVGEDDKNYYVDFCQFPKSMYRLDTIFNSLSQEDTSKPFRMDGEDSCVNTLDDYAFSLYPFSNQVE